MASKRERRLRRKAKAKLAAAVASSQKALSMMPVARAAIRYISEIDAPNLREPWSIDSRRRELRAIVHQYLGRAPERRAAVFAPAQSAEHQSSIYRRVTIPTEAATPVLLPPARPPATTTAVEWAEQLRAVELKKKDLHLAAMKYGAVANDRAHRLDARPLAEAVDAAARALASAETKLAALHARRTDPAPNSAEGLQRIAGGSR